MNVELQVPTDLSEISLKKYQAFISLKADDDNDEFIARKMVSIFCGIKLGHVGAIKYRDLCDITDKFTQMFLSKTPFINRFELGGVEFGFIPDLENISLDEYVDLDLTLNDPSKLHKAMAVMYRPITEKKGNTYDIEPYISTVTYAEVMENAPLNIVFGAVVFFWTLKRELLIASISYLEKELQMSLTKQTNLELNGDGIIASLHSLKETLQSLMQSANFQPLNASHSLLMKPNE